MKKFSYWNICFFIVVPFFIVITSYGYPKVITNPESINFASSYSQTDSLKAKILEKNIEMRLTQNPNLIVQSTYSEKPNYNYNIDKQPDSLYGIQLLDATSLFAINIQIIYWTNGNPVPQSYIYGNGVTYPLYNNGVETFIQGDSTRWSVDYPAGLYSDVKFFQEKKFFIMNVIFNPNNLEQSAMPLRQLAMSHGDPYISAVMFVIYPHGNDLPTKFMFITKRYTKQNGEDAFEPEIVALGVQDYTIFPTNPAYFYQLRASTWGFTRIWDRGGFQQLQGRIPRCQHRLQRCAGQPPPAWHTGAKHNRHQYNLYPSSRKVFTFSKLPKPL